MRPRTAAATASTRWSPERRGLPPRLGRAAEGYLHELLAECLAEAAIRRPHAALPARFLLFRPRQRLAIEIEILRLERRRQYRDRAMNHMPGEVRLHVVEAGRADHTVESFEELRHADIELLERRRAFFSEVARPFKARSQTRQVLHGHGVVGVIRIAPRHAFQREFGQLGLDRHHHLGLRFRIPSGVLRLGQQIEHIGHMLGIFRPQIDGARVRLEIVVAIRQADSALVDIGDVHARVLRVRPRAEAK